MTSENYLKINFFNPSTPEYHVTQKSLIFIKV